MTYTNTSERNIPTLLAIACIFAVSAFVFVGVARADETGWYTYGEGYTPSSASADTGWYTYGEGYTPTLGGISESLGGTYEQLGGTYEQLGGTYQTLGGTYQTYTSAIPTYDYGYNSYGNSLAYGVGYGLGYAAMSYPYYTYQNYPVVASAPSNTSVYSPTSIVAPTNTCTAPNTCNTTVDDHSVVSAPTYAQPATAYVSPVVQTVPYYTAQAYVPSYSYSSPSYVYTNPAPYYAPVNPVVNPSPYVALTQIPYTGLDLGLFGNALYWIVLAGVALAGAYLLVYYLPSLKFLPALKLRQAGRQANSRGDPAEQQAVYGAGTLPARASTHAGGQSQGVTSPKVSEETPSKCEGVTSGTESHLRNIYRGTSDIMQVIKSAHGAAPRIVISRA